MAYVAVSMTDDHMTRRGMAESVTELDGNGEDPVFIFSTSWAANWAGIRCEGRSLKAGLSMPPVPVRMSQGKRASMSEAKRFEAINGLPKKVVTILEGEIPSSTISQRRFSKQWIDAEDAPKQKKDPCATWYGTLAPGDVSAKFRVVKSVAEAEASLEDPPPQAGYQVFWLAWVTHGMLVDLDLLAALLAEKPEHPQTIPSSAFPNEYIPCFHSLEQAMISGLAVAERHYSWKIEKLETAQLQCCKVYIPNWAANGKFLNFGEGKGGLHVKLTDLTVESRATLGTNTSEESLRTGQEHFANFACTTEKLFKCTTAAGSSGKTMHGYVHFSRRGLFWKEVECLSLEEREHAHQLGYWLAQMRRAQSDLDAATTMVNQLRQSPPALAGESDENEDDSDGPADDPPGAPGNPRSKRQRAGTSCTDVV